MTAVLTVVTTTFRHPPGTVIIGTITGTITGTEGGPMSYASGIGRSFGTVAM